MTIQGHPAHKAPVAPVVKIVVPGVVPPAAAVAAAMVVKTTIGLKRPTQGSSSRRPAQHSLQGQGSLSKAPAEAPLAVMTIS